MPKPPRRSWKIAFLQTPGPKSLPAAVWLALKGVCMGAADVIPGVSGGTIALITGIYQELVTAIRSVDMQALKLLLTLDVKGALARVHFRFLLILFGGIGLAVVSLARLMNYLLYQHPVHTRSLFFGLIAASILVVSRKVSGWLGAAGAWFLAGTAAGSFIVSRLPITTPDDLWFLFICGTVAICAMILPGISGAFILLILGKYEFVTATLKNPLLPHNAMVIAVFGLGCVLGLAAFSRVLAYLLKHRQNLTLSFLTGLMAGSIQKIWPWKEILEIRFMRGKEHVIWGANTLPESPSETAVALLLAAAGFFFVLALEHLSAVQWKNGR
jgi:putative membrane protein